MLTGTLPSDNQQQPASLLDAAFEGTTGVERLILAGGTLAQSANAVLGQFAQRAGLQEVVAGGTGGQAQIIDIIGFAGALTVTGSGNAEVVNVNQNTAGVKTLNLGAGADVVNVTAATGATAGSTQINFTSGAVGDGNDRTATGAIANPVTIVNAAGNIVLNDEGTTIVGSINNQFNVVGLAADGSLDLANQNRGNFQTVILGTNQADTTSTVGRAGNVYINSGQGNDNFRILAAEGVAGVPAIPQFGIPAIAPIAEVASAADTRHFAVGGAGEDNLNILSRGAVVGILGAGNDTVLVRDASADGSNNGTVSINFAAGSVAGETNTVTFSDAAVGNNLVLNTAPAGGVSTNDTLTGGLGRDTLVASSAELTAVVAAAVPANQSISGFEALTVSNAEVATTLVTSRIQSGIDTVSLNGTNVAASNITFDGGVAATLNLGAAATGVINVSSAGTGTTDRVTIANTAAAQTVAPNAGVATNAFGNQAIVATNVETLIINTSATGNANPQTINGITITPSGTATATVNFVGGNSVTAGLVGARVVDASGLTGTAGLTATSTNTAAPTGTTNTVTGSANADAITLGTAANNVSLGAGNDTVVIAAVNGLAAGTSVLAGGEGTDTLRASVADAATLSVANPFNANLSGFEQLSINNHQLGVTNTIRVDNLGVNKVISSGLAGNGVAPNIVAPVITQGVAPVAAAIEAITVAGLNGLGAGEALTLTVGAVTRTVTASAGTPGTASVQRFSVDSILDTVTTGNGIETYQFTLAGRTIQFRLVNGNSLTEAEVAAAFASGVSDLDGSTQWTITGNLDSAYTVAADNGQLVFTAVNPGLQTQLAVTNFATNDAANNMTPAFVMTNSTLGTNAISGGLTAANLATVLATGMAGTTGATVADAGGTFPFDMGMVTGNSVAFGATAPGALTDATVAVTAGVAPTVTVNTQGVTQVTGVNEVARLFFVDLTAGQSITFGGRTVTAVDGPVSAQAVALAFVAGTNQNGVQVTGTLADGFTAAVNNNARVTLTGPQANVTDITAVAGAATGRIILQNLDSGGTLELTGAGNGGTHEVRIIDSGLNTNDVLNLELTNGTGGFLDYGTVQVVNTETINILTRDIGTDGNTAATRDFIFLNAASATSIVVTGNNGLVVGGNGAAVTNFDASGIVGNSANDTAANLGVIFFSANNTAGATVTIRGGAGNDEFFSGGANDTFDLTTGGSDVVDFSATRAANGLDTINGFTAGAVTDTGAADVLGLNGGAADLRDANGDAAGLIFNATAANTAGDLVITGINFNAYLVVDGNGTLNAANVKSQITGASAQNGEILVEDGASAYVLHASSADSNVFNVYRAFDADGINNNGQVDARIELVGVVNLTNTFGNLVANNIA